jgi:hypothetical protein
VVNATISTLPRFYIFKKEKMRNNYIKYDKARSCMVMQRNAWMASFLFKESLSFFKKIVLSGISQSNCHLLIMDGHGSHVMLKTIKQA